MVLSHLPESHSACLQLKTELQGGPMRFAVKFDGCVNIDDFDREVIALHICDLQEFISALQAVHAAAVAHFGDQWP